MINLITESISISLNAEFGDGCRIYREEVKQGLEEPCFFISCINTADRLFVGKKHFRQNQFCIQYLPKDELHGNEECHAVAERLFECLEYVAINGARIRGTKMSYEVTEGILDFFVNFDCYVYRVEEGIPAMGELVQGIAAKG